MLFLTSTALMEFVGIKVKVLHESICFKEKEQDSWPVSFLR